MRSTLALALAFVAMASPATLACSESSDGAGPGSGGTVSGGGSSPSGAGSGGLAGDAGSGSSGAGAGGNGSSGGTGGSSGDDQPFVPAGLPNTELSGQDNGLTLVAFTLQRGTSGLELYAAVRNDGDTPACDAGMLVDFTDRSGRLVGSWGGSLPSGRLYRLNDGSGVIIPCVAPGEIVMTGSTELPEGIAIEELGALTHTFPAFTVDVLPAGVVGIGELETIAGNAYAGTLQNGLDVTVSNPRVMVFPVNRAGRPLGMATSSVALDISPGESWSFETSSVAQLGADYAAYPAVTIALQ